jgi:hypothetical protein
MPRAAARSKLCQRVLTTCLNRELHKRETATQQVSECRDRIAASSREKKNIMFQGLAQEEPQGQVHAARPRPRARAARTQYKPRGHSDASDKRRELNKSRKPDRKLHKSMPHTARGVHHARTAHVCTLHVTTLYFNAQITGIQIWSPSALKGWVCACAVGAFHADAHGHSGA